MALCIAEGHQFERETYRSQLVSLNVHFLRDREVHLDERFAGTNGLPISKFENLIIRTFQNHPGAPFKLRLRGI